MHSSFKSFHTQISLLLDDEPFSQREAWQWLVDNTAATGFITYSIRNIAQIWQWHKSKVERFIKKLKMHGFIETSIEARVLVINICNIERFSGYPNKSGTVIAIQPETNLENLTEKTANQDTDQLQSDAAQSKYLPISEVSPWDKIKTSRKTITGTSAPEQKEEKKEKDQKKETEEKEKQKEKNTPYRGLKKEKQKEAESEVLFSANGTDKAYRIESDTDRAKTDQSLTAESTNLTGEATTVEETAIITAASKNNRQISYLDVKIEHIIDWAVDQLIDQAVNPEWELAKFKDYWQLTRKKPPKDGIAAFRNWLRKAVELQQIRKGNQNERFSYEPPRNDRKPRSALDNFLCGAAELAAYYEGYSVDRDGSHPAEERNPDNKARFRSVPRTDD